MIDERSEFGLVSAPMRRPVEGKAEEYDVSRRCQGRFSKEGPAQQAKGERELKKRRDPGEEQRGRKAGRRNIVCGLPYAGKLERHRHCENGSEDKPCDKNGSAGPDRGRRTHGGSPVDRFSGCTSSQGSECIQAFAVGLSSRGRNRAPGPDNPSRQI